jgi:hypothetical protein
MKKVDSNKYFYYKLSLVVGFVIIALALIFTGNVGSIAFIGGPFILVMLFT